jgi:hypothetical protein
MIYVVISIMLIIVSIVRRKRSEHDFADAYQPLPQEPDSSAANAAQRPKQAGKRVWGREFR